MQHAWQSGVRDLDSCTEPRAGPRCQPKQLIRVTGGHAMIALISVNNASQLLGIEYKLAGRMLLWIHVPPLVLVDLLW